MQEIAIKYIGLLESPSPRKMELMILYAVIKGMPIKQIIRYVTVPDTASAGVDMTDTIGFTKSSNNRVAAADRPINRAAVLPIAARAYEEFLAPTALPMVTVDPMASPTIMTVSMCIT